MKLIKLIFSSFLLLTAYTAQSQGLYIEGSLGWNFALTSNTNMMSNVSSTDVYDYDNNSFSSSYTEEIVCLNLGKGGGLGATFGYMFNEHIGAEVQLNYLLGGRTNSTYESRFTEIQNGMSTTSTSTYKDQYSSNMFRAIPSFVVQTQLNRVSPYAKIGLVLGFGSVNIIQDFNDQGTRGSYEAKLNQGVALGLNTRVGCLFSTKGALSYFVELNVIGMDYAPKKGEITKYIVDGMDQLPNLSTSDKEVEFVKEINSDGDFDENKPDQVLIMNLPFSSIGVNFGVRFDLN